MSDVQQINSLLDQLSEERRRGKTTRIGLTSAIVLIIGGFVGNLYYKVTHFDSDALLRHMETQASQTVWPVYNRELQALASDAVPAITEALENEAEALLPKVSERLGKEAVLFQENMSKTFKASLTRNFNNSIRGHEAEFKKRFPDFEDREEVYEELARRMEKGARDWAQRKLDTTFAEHLLILQSINETVMALMEEAASDLKDGKKANVDDVLSIMAEILNTRVAGEG